MLAYWNWNLCNTVHIAVNNSAGKAGEVEIMVGVDSVIVQIEAKDLIADKEWTAGVRSKNEDLAEGVNRIFVGLKIRGFAINSK